MNDLPKKVPGDLAVYIICVPDPRDENTYLVERGQHCFYIKIGDTDNPLDPQANEALGDNGPQGPRTGYTTHNPTFWAVVNSTRPRQNGNFDKLGYRVHGKGMENRYLKPRDPSNPREWYRITPNELLKDAWSIEELRSNIKECMEVFQDPGTQLGASQTYPRINKYMTGTQTMLYTTWKLWMKDIMDHCDCGLAPPVSLLKKSPVPVQQFTSSQEVLDNIGFEEDNEDKIDFENLAAELAKNNQYQTYAKVHWNPNTPGIHDQQPMNLEEGTSQSNQVIGIKADTDDQDMREKVDAMYAQLEANSVQHFKVEYYDRETLERLEREYQFKKKLHEKLEKAYGPDFLNKLLLRGEKK